MSTILYFTSDRIAFTNVSATKNAETILLVPDPNLGNSLFIGNSTMVTYDAACNISTFNGSKALMTINTNTSQIGIGTSSPTTAFDVVDSRGINIVGPANITGTVSGTYFYGSALGLTNIPAARIVGTLASANFSSSTIPADAIIGGTATNQASTASTFTSFLTVFSSISTLAISTGVLTANTINVSSLNVISISSASLGSLVGGSGNFSSLNTSSIYVNYISSAAAIINNLSITTLNTSGLATFSGGISTTSISSAAAYINTLTADSGSYGGSLNVATLNTTTATTHSNSVSITTGGLTVGGLTVLSNGLSTTAISTANAYIAKRQAEYPSLADFADAYYWAQNGDDTKMTAYIDKCEAVKTKYPKS